MVDRPQPLKQGRPAPLNPNSADKFNETHQGEYEARSRPSDESKKLDEVIQRHTAHPKLRNELDRRRSVVEVKAYKHRNGPRCDACEKRRQLAELKRLKIKPRCQDRRRRSVSRRRKAGVRKNKRYKRKVTLRRARGPYRKNAGKTSDDEEGGDGTVVSSLQNPDSTHTSMTSFHTYPSVGHEPMDA